MAITGIDTIEGKQIIAAGAISAKSAEMAYNDENGNPITGYQIAGDYYSASNPSGFITGVDLTPYQTTAGMTAYQSAGDYYSASNPSGFITGVPDTYLQNTDLTISDNKVTEISGIPLSAGTELEFEYDAADNISAINHSAISTTPSQDLYAKSPLYFDVTGTSSYMGINSADLARMLGIDETVLYNGDLTASSSAALTESWLNFDRIKIFGYSQPGGSMYGEAQVSDISGNYEQNILIADINLATVASWVHRDNFNIIASMPIVFIDNTTISAMNGRLMGYWNGEWQTSFNEQRSHCTKVIGIGRKENV